jgi:hypothetical protein
MGRLCPYDVSPFLFLLLCHSSFLLHHADFVSFVKSFPQLHGGLRMLSLLEFMHNVLLF